MSRIQVKISMFVLTFVFRLFCFQLSKNKLEITVKYFKQIDSVDMRQHLTIQKLTKLSKLHKIIQCINILTSVQILMDFFLKFAQICTKSYHSIKMHILLSFLVTSKN